MTNHAILIQSAGKAKVVEASIPRLRDEYLLVKTHAVALNPTDFKHIDFMPTEGARVGCDYAGEVLEVGSKVSKSFKKGDRVAGFCHGSNADELEDGSFGEIIAPKAAIQIVIPANLSYEEAATLGVGIITVGQGLYQSLQLPLPTEPAKEKIPILIYGGSTATGSLAIQFAKLSGAEVFTTCSPRNFEYVKSLGATAAFDYSDKNCVADIKKATSDKLGLVFDCISEGESINISVGALSTSSGGRYSTLVPVPEEKVTSINSKATCKMTLGYTAIGEEFSKMGKKFPANEEHLKFASMWWGVAREFLENGKVKVHNIKVNEGGEGLEGALHGLDLLRQGKVSGEKLVYTL